MAHFLKTCIRLSIDSKTLMNIKISLHAQDDCVIEIKPSKRAKYLRLNIDHEGNVQITLPTNYTIENAQAFAVSKRAWIAEKLQAIRQQPVVAPITLPKQFIIPLMQETWDIEYHQTDYASLHRYIDVGKLSIRLEGKVDDQTLVFRYFDQWLKESGKIYLPGMLEQVSREIGLSYNRVSIRKQKTLWGSCSSKQNISLNCKLLFMPVSVVRYVMVHELCHTQEMNHSKCFWALVEKHDPEFRKHEAMLKQSKRYIPRGI